MGKRERKSASFDSGSSAAVLRQTGSGASGSRYSKCSPWTSNISITRLLVRNAESSSPARHLESSLHFLQIPS